MGKGERRSGKVGNKGGERETAREDQGEMLGKKGGRKGGRRKGGNNSTCGSRGKNELQMSRSNMPKEGLVCLGSAEGQFCALC